MDIVSKEVRSRMMAGIRSSDTSPEMKIRRLLHRCGFRYRLHKRELPGRPDLVLSRYKVCIFVNGCFWHRHPGCKYSTTPRVHEEFWRKKFNQNIARDARNKEKLLASGWRVFELWECGIRGPEAALLWIVDAIMDCNQKIVVWPELLSNHSLASAIRQNES
ncbi:very short patch repair endonuclease [Pseudomonas sp. BIGb0381]|uniref:very short patch repair endonuclease n=1 Tax=Pseudomonas sp. BIGb0381 TaxID=2940608 RepID=UPI00216A9924|nr:very short patch repair endonuclease [Pseudomonas sp. BIGb0381]